MVEQENSQASPAFPESQNSNARLQNAFRNPWFMIDSTALINEEPLCSSGLNVDIEEKECHLSEDVLSKDEISLNDYILNEKYAKVRGVTKLEGWWQPLSEIFPASSDPYFEANSPLSFWGTCPLDLETMKIDDVFQVDKDDLVQSPTLAELNANDESLFDSFDCFDAFFPTGDKTLLSKSLSIPDINSDFKISAFNNGDHPKHIVSETSVLEKDQEFPLKDEPSIKKQHLNLACEELNIKPKLESSQNDVKLQTVPTLVVGPKKETFHRPLVSSSAEHDDKEPLSTDSVDEKCTDVYHMAHLLNNDHSDSDDESEMDGDYSSDADEDSEEETKAYSTKHSSVSRINLEKKRSRYFWQYNIQAKGPKGPRMKLTGKSKNAHKVPGVGDPIFSANCPIEGVKHSGKARRGDGNDLTPNPKKLHNIGKELEKLNCLIDGLVPVNELPVNARTKSRKEKNKLASRACRLKKKAQHEANKLKLFGLQEEQKYLLMLVSEIKKLVKTRMVHFKQTKDQSIMAAIELLQIRKSVTKVAGCSADYVNTVLRCVASGDESGGLKIALTHEN